MLPAPPSPAASARASTSSNPACRDGTGRPSWSVCVGACDDEKPAAPAAIAARTSRRICSSSSAVAARSEAASPMTKRRSAEWPTYTAALIPSRRSSTSRNDGKLSQSHGSPLRRTDGVMPSTLAKSAVTHSRPVIRS